MNIPAHPEGIDEPAPPSPHSRRRSVIVVVAIVVVLATLHLLRNVVG